MAYSFLKPVASFNSSENYVQLGVTFNNVKVIPSNQIASIKFNYNQHLVSKYASLVQQIFPMFYDAIFTAYVDVKKKETTMFNATDNFLAEMFNATDNTVAYIALFPQSFFVLQ